MTDYLIDPNAVVARRFKDRLRPEWKAAVLCFRDAPGSRALVEAMGGRPLAEKILWGMEADASAPLVHEAAVNGTLVGMVSRCIWGGPQAALLVEELAVLGIKTMIGFGAGGSLDPALARGSQVYVEAALRTDGTSLHYPDAAPLGPDAALVSALREVEVRLGLPVKGVVAATMDAPYRESEPLLHTWAGQGAQLVNMESAAFYAAAKTCEVRAIWLGHVSDHLVGSWQDWHGDRAEMTLASARICRELLKVVA